MKRTHPQPTNPNDKYTLCPDCECKTVYFRMKANREDNWQCRRQKCHFFFFTLSSAQVDLDNEKRWREKNGFPPEGSAHA